MTLDFIPLDLYSPLFYTATLIVGFTVLLQCVTVRIGSAVNLTFMSVFGNLTMLFILLYMGLRPISGMYFGDMSTYAYMYDEVQSGYYQLNLKDPLFASFVEICSKIMDKDGFFFLCAVIYIVPLYFVTKKYLGRYWFYAFLMLASSFSFWAYGTNGIRNGIAASLFLYAISCEKHVSQIIWIVIAVGFHKSIILPAFAYVLTHFYNDPKKYIYFWLACIPLSLILGNTLTGFFASLGFADDRVGYLIAEADASQFSSVGFRWDFLAYSATAVFAGWYYIVRKKFNDLLYSRLFNIYVFSNAFWILVIRSNFSNRFAYLSWFMIGLVLIFPLLKSKLLVNQHLKIGLIIFFNSLFTFIMYIKST